MLNHRAKVVWLAQARPQVQISAMTEAALDARPIPPAPRYYAGFNWLGFQTLYLREVKRFWKVWLQTVVSPIVTTLLYMLVFVVAIGQARPTVMGVSFAEFVAPGLIMMSILSNAFANSSSSLLQAKMMGLTPDFLTPPLSSVEQAAAFSAGAVTRGLLVGLVTAVAVWPFSHFQIAHLWAVLYFGFGAALMMGTAGVFVGLWSEKFDHLAAVSNFVILPMTFLSGTFFVIDNLPGPAQTLSAANPFFYVIDGFRYGFIGGADGHLLTGVIIVAALNVVLAIGCWALFHTGYRLRT
jgi:ABC-2 type transport system permease protein